MTNRVRNQVTVRERNVRGRKFNSQLLTFGQISEFTTMSGEPNEVQKWKCPFCGLKIEDRDSQSFRQRVIFHRKMHDDS